MCLSTCGKAVCFRVQLHALVLQAPWVLVAAWTDFRVDWQSCGMQKDASRCPATCGQNMDCGHACGHRCGECAANGTKPNGKGDSMSFACKTTDSCMIHKSHLIHWQQGDWLGSRLRFALHSCSGLQPWQCSTPSAKVIAALFYEKSALMLERLHG